MNFGKAGKNVGMILAGLTGMVVGGLLINGAALDVFLLEFLPEVVHTVVGYILSFGGVLSIGGAIWNFIRGK